MRVVDRGPGIPPAQLERVFEPFYRAGTARGGHRGSGLGLAIARGFTEANGGTLHVESLPGQGATFVFELPLESTAEQARRDRPSVDGQCGCADGRPRQPRVLVVDDEPQILRALKVVLREAGFEARAAETAARGARSRGGAPAAGGDRRSGVAGR